MTTPPDPPVDPAITAATAQANLAKLQADVRKATADAGAAEVAARSGALAAAIGTVPASGVSGTVTTSDAAGLAEGNALAIAGLRTVAATIATQLAAASAAGNILLVAGAAAPVRTTARAFDFQVKLVARALDDALAATALAAAPGAGHGPMRPAAVAEDGAARAAAVPLLPAAGLILSGINAVVGYARTDFTLGGRDLKPNERALLAAVAQGLAAAGKTVRVVTPPVGDATLDAVTARIERLADSAATARTRAATYAAAIARLTPPATPPEPHADHGKPSHDPAGGHLAAYQRAVPILDAAVATFDAFYQSLLGDDGSGPLVLRIAAAVELEAFLAEGAVALVALDGAFSSTLSRKSLWSGLLGRVPYELNALVTASWQLLDGATLTVLAAGVEADLAPYTALLDVSLTPQSDTPAA